jgi:hypothetical protein
VEKFMAGQKGLSDFTKQLLPYFVEQKIVKHLPEIKDQFLKLMKEKRGEIDVFVTSADPLAPETLKTLEGLIVKQIGAQGGAKVRACVCWERGEVGRLTGVMGGECVFVYVGRLGGCWGWLMEDTGTHRLARTRTRPRGNDRPTLPTNHSTKQRTNPPPGR